MLVGDTAVGKSCLITNYLHNTFSENYEPTVLDVYKGTKSVNKTQVNLELHDTSGDDNLQANRKVQYQGAHCFMICVAVNKKSSFDNISKWKEEITSVIDGKPIFLILTKSDIDDPAVTLKDLKGVKDADGSFVGVAKTSSKEWDDFNVHKAFNKALGATLKLQE